jgi:hypothetical protein
MQSDVRECVVSGQSKRVDVALGPARTECPRARPLRAAGPQRRAWPLVLNEPVATGDRGIDPVQREDYVKIRKSSSSVSSIPT